jgi:hypothetical protein
MTDEDKDGARHVYVVELTYTHYLNGTFNTQSQTALLTFTCTSLTTVCNNQRQHSSHGMEGKSQSVSRNRTGTIQRVILKPITYTSITHLGLMHS